MKIQDFIEFAQELEHMIESGAADPDADVRLAMQPRWPFEYAIGTPVVVNGTVYLPESRQIGYLPGEVAEEIEW